MLLNSLYFAKVKLHSFTISPNHVAVIVKCNSKVKVNNLTISANLVTVKPNEVKLKIRR